MCPFIDGFLSLFGVVPEVPFLSVSDEEALKSDWQLVGSSLYDAFLQSLSE